MTEDKIDLIGLSLNEISETLISKDLIQAKEKLRSKQLWHWLYFCLLYTSPSPRD